MSETATQAQQPRKMSGTITLAEPVQRGDQVIADIVLRKPKAGELRGLSIQELMNARTSAVLDLLPRITVPPLLAHEVEQLEPEDLAACGGAIIDFFLTPADRQAVERVLKG